MLPARRVVWCLVVATVATVALYWPSLSFDLYADDYLYLRPWTWEELRTAWAGPWLPFPTAPPFHRPVATTLYTALFGLFGMNAAAMHWLPLPLMILTASLVGLYIGRMLDDDHAAWLGALLFVILPGSVTAIGPWIVNQYHGILALTAVTAWLLWPRTHHTSPLRWVVLTMLGVVAAWTKEDGAMLPLATVFGHAVAAWWSRSPHRPGWPVISAACGLFVAVFTWRMFVLGTFGGYSWWPTPLDMVLNLARGVLWIPLVQRGALPWSAIATALTVALCVHGAWQAWRRPAAPTTRLFVFAGVALLVFVLPHSLMTSVTRGHLLSLASVVLLTAAATSWLRGGFVPRAALATGLVALAMVSSERMQAFAPCSAEALYELRWVTPDVRAFGPPELADWLEDLPACPAGTHRSLVEEVETLTWGLTAPSTRVVMLVHQRVQQVQWSVSSDTTQRVTLRIEGQPWQEMEVGPEPRMLDVTLTPTWRTSLRRMHRVEIVAPHPTRWTSRVAVTTRTTRE